MSELLIGLREIAKYLRISEGTLRNRSRELQDLGVLWIVYRGRPCRPWVMTSTDRLQAWMMAEGELRAEARRRK